MIKLAASIMCANQLEIGNELKKLEAAQIDLLHCDVMDGVFVNNLGMGPYVLEKIKEFSKIPLDIHLATERPENFIRMFLDIKPEFITFHVEAADNYYKALDLIKENNIKASMAISPDTSVNVIKDVIKYLDMILIMTVEPGFSGQHFKPYVIDKIKKVKEMCNEKNINPLIEVDGNINKETIPSVVAMGANILVLGTSSIFNPHVSDYTNYIRNIKLMLN